PSVAGSIPAWPTKRGRGGPDARQNTRRDDRGADVSSHTDIGDADMEGFRRSDLSVIFALLTDDGDWDLPGFRHLTGKADFEGEIVNPQFEENPTLVVNRKVEDGDTVVCIGEGQGQMKVGDEFRFAFCDVFTFRDDLICRVESYVVPLSGPFLAELAGQEVESANPLERSEHVVKRRFRRRRCEDRQPRRRPGERDIEARH